MELGYVSGVFGVQGEVKVFLHHPESDLFQAPLELEFLLAEGERRRCRLTIRRGSGRRMIGRIEGVQSREEAVGWKGARFSIAKEHLPELDANEYYVRDLVGLTVRTGEGEQGTVVGVHDVGNRDLLEVKRGKEVFFVPLEDEYVDEVNIDEGWVCLVPDAMERF